MISHKPKDQQLIAAIDACFVDAIGPIAPLLIEDAKHLWRQKQWQGPAALRNYIKALSINIDSLNDKQAFIKQTSQIVMDAEAAKKQNL